MENSKYKILIVDDEVANLKLLQNILEDDYQLAFATNGIKAIRAAKYIKPDLILMDVMMPELDGFESCRRLKANEKLASIPIIFVTALSDSEDEIKGLKVGGVDFIRKPISSHIVQARVSTHISLYNKQKECEKAIIKRTKELEVSNKAAIAMLAEAGHFNDTDTGVHIWRMSAYASAIARSAGGWSVERSKILELAAAMHDTGKIGIQDSILKKPGPLTKEEFDIIKTHTTIGHSILSITGKKSQLFSMAADIAFYHHEKWNGKGYPNGLSGKQIPESARIAAIADVFDALTMRRSYKEPWTVEEAFDEIQNGRGEHFDPYLVDCFFNIKEEIIDIKNKWVDMDSNYDWFGDTDYIAII